MSDEPRAVPDATVPDTAVPEATVPLPTSRIGRILAFPIVAYRRWISPALPPTCRFYPSCSEYALTAIARHGAARGLALGVWRILRCHPFHPGGVDHVPPVRHHDHPHRDPHRDDVTGVLTS